MVLFKNAIRHSVQKNITDSPLGPALLKENSCILDQVSPGTLTQDLH